MNMNITINKDTLIRLLQSYYSILIIIALCSLIAYTGYHVNQSFDIKPDQAVIKDAKKKAISLDLDPKKDKETLDLLSSLQPSPSTTVTDLPGNPFRP